MKRFFPVFFFLMFSGYGAITQTIPHLQYGAEDGLGNSVVFDIFQDSKGYMWFSTDHGLSKFDGVHFVNYTMAEGLPTNYIMCITQTSDGVLWIATYGYGICKYQNGKFTPQKYNNPDFSPFNITVRADKKDRVWIYSGGKPNMDLWYIENDQVKKFNIKDYINDTSTYVFYGVFLKSDGEVLFPTNKGAFALTDHQLTPLLNNNLPVTTINEDKAGNLWLGLNNKIIELSNGGKIRTIDKDDIKDEGISLVDDRARLWSIDYPKHFFAINGASGKIDYREDVPVTGFYADREDNIWTSTFGQGVFCYNYPDIINYTVKDGLFDNIISKISEDNQGRLWIATLRGICYIDNDRSRENFVVPFIKHEDVFSFIVNDKDDLYYGWESLFAIVKNGKTKEINLIGHIRSLYKAPDGKIWVAMDGGIAYYQNEAVSFPKELSFLKGKRNLAVLQDSKGKLWFGTDNGVYSYHDNKMEHYTTAEGLANNIVNGIWQDKKGRMWFATGEGVSVLDNGKWVNDSLLKTLNHTMCTSFVSDSSGNIWIGTFNGLYVYDGSRIRKFDNLTGLAGIEIQSLCLDSRNCLWVGTIKGVSRIDLNRYSAMISPYSPPIYIQTIKVNNTVYKQNDSTPVKLSYSENNVRISYMGLYFKNPKSLSYEYKLSGAASENWIKTSNTSVEFSSLSPGKYNFLVRALTPDGVYSKMPASVAFTILPPFWLQPWFILIEVIIGIIAISILFRVRLRIYKQKAMAKLEKQRMEEELQNARKALEEFTRSMVEKNELLEQFKTDLDKLKVLKSKEVEEVRIEQLEHLNKTTILTEEDWNKFKKLFEEVYKGFFIRLKEKLPDLTQAEIRLVCLTKLKFNTKQMADILGVSFDTIKKTRHRLRRKLDLSEVDNIDDIVESI